MSTVNHGQLNAGDDDQPPTRSAGTSPTDTAVPFHADTCRRSIMHSLNVTRSCTSSQWRVSCRTCVKPWSNFRVFVTMLAAEFITRCSLSVTTFGVFVFFTWQINSVLLCFLCQIECSSWQVCARICMTLHRNLMQGICACFYCKVLVVVSWVCLSACVRYNSMT